MITIGGMTTPILLTSGWEVGAEQPHEEPILMDLRSLVNIFFIKEVIPSFWFKMLGDKPFPLPMRRWCSQRTLVAATIGK